MSENKGNNAVTTVIAVIVVAVIIALIVWAFSGRDNEGVDDATTNDETTNVIEDEQESTLTMILDDPSAYIGETVTVTAEVQDVLTDRIFKVSDDTVGDELTVLAPQALTDEQAQQATEFLQDNANVRVEGVVRTATVAEVERDYDLTLDPELEAEFENRTVLVANSITFTDQSGGFWDFDLDTEATTEDDTAN